MKKGYNIIYIYIYIHIYKYLWKSNWFMSYVTESAQHAQSKDHNTYIVKSWRQSNAPILLITTMPLWPHARYGRPVYALCFVQVEHSVYHEPISVLINKFMPLAQCLLSTLFVLTLTTHELNHWPYTVGILPQSHCSDEDRCTGLSSWSHYIIYIYIYIY